MIEPSVPAQAKAWIGAAEYLSGRIQSTPSQMAGRAPDMGPAAAAAMRGVMTELAESAEAWAQLYGALEQSACSRRPKPAQSDDLTVCYTEGIATRHDSSAREEAARKVGRHSVAPPPREPAPRLLRGQRQRWAVDWPHQDSPHPIPPSHPPIPSPTHPPPSPRLFPATCHRSSPTTPLSFST